MKLEDFNSMSDEEKANYLSSVENNSKQIEDLTAERDSFKAENEDLTNKLSSSSQELKATKELNFTLARKVNVAENKDTEQVIYEFMKGYKR